MTYEETLAYLYASQPAFHIVGAAAYKPGLDNTRRLLAHLGMPHERFRSVHIAGTNGKGSTSHLTAAVLQCAGYKVGLYTSPHLVDFRERIRVNGEMITKEAVVRFVEDNRAFLEEVKPSFFETTMAMAFDWFARQGVDIAVVECGLGGRLDSTNIITPVVSVITNIGMDHTEFLGDTLPKIAAEKAGIIKPGVPCVIGETNEETMPVFLAKAAECGILGEGLETSGCRIWFADQCGYMRHCRRRDVPKCQLEGIYQEKNMQTAYVALQAVRNYGTDMQGKPIAVSAEAIRKGYEKVCDLTGLRGRWETLATEPLIICDTGHNSHGIRYVAKQLEALRGHYSTLRMVFGMVADKDISTVLELLPREAEYYFTQPANHRAFPAERLAEMWDEALRIKDERLNCSDYEISDTKVKSPSSCVLHPSSCRAFPRVADALRAARAEAAADDLIFIGGSNYVVGEAMRAIEAEKR